MIDVVYILGSGSKWADNELRYSLRSVALYLRNVRRILVVGDFPRFRDATMEVPFFYRRAVDCHGDKQWNAQAKLNFIADMRDVTEQFVLLNDDFFFLRSTDAATIPYYSPGTLAQHIARRASGSSRYKQSLTRTQKRLQESGLPSMDYEVHGPIIYEKARVREVLARFDCLNSGSYLFRSLYANAVGVSPVPRRDCKIDSPLTRDAIELRLKQREFFSLGDRALNSDMKAFLASLFTYYENPEPFESGAGDGAPVLGADAASSADS